MTTTLSPAAVNRRAAAAPTPSLDPVITMVRFDTCVVPLDRRSMIEPLTGKPYWICLQ